MNHLLSAMKTNHERFWKRLTIGLVALITLLTLAQPASAHHPFGGQTPSNLFEGFLSGLGHPVVGFDHLTFVIASGLVAANTKRGWMIPVGFVMTAMVGTGLHLQGANLPILEVMIGASVLAMGG
ncbi:MAG: HupE/UreJ family protein, partial [Halothece sp. Uz-M2-17]|nr:HupE/UreJ family protein [Halothece sp. Uz-M2-17]